MVLQFKQAPLQCAEEALSQLLQHLLGYVSYRLVATCIILVPLTHLLTLCLFGWMAKEGSTLSRLLLLNGGKRHQAFSTAGWMLWAISALASLPVWLSHSSLPHSLPPWLHGDEGFINSLPVVPHSHVDVISGAAAATSFVGELFLVQALLVYEPTGLRQSKVQALAASKRLPGAQLLVQAILLLGKSGIARYAAAALVVFIGLMLSITGALLLLSVEHMPDVPSRVLYCCLSLVCLIIGASSTHGLGGYLQWGSRPLKSVGLSRHSSTDNNKRRTADRQGSGASLDEGSPNLPKGAYKPLWEDTDGSPLDDEGDLSSFGTDKPLLLRAPEPVSGGETAGKSNIPTINRKDSGAALEVDDQQGGSDWHFFQPFAGGTVFVGTQAVGWTLFSLTSCYMFILSKALVTGMVHTLRSYLLGGSVLMMTTQTVLALSLVTWRARRAARQLTKSRSRRQSFSSISSPSDAQAADSPFAQPQRPARKGLLRLFSRGKDRAAQKYKAGVEQEGTQQAQQAQQEPAPPLSEILWEEAREIYLRNVPLFVMYLPSHGFFSLWAITFVFCPPHYAAIFWLLFMPVYFAMTVRNEPQHTGVRMWQRLCTWLSENADTSLTAWFGRVEVVLDKPETSSKNQNKTKANKFEPSSHYIFGFHPHGLYPTGAGFLGMLRGFREQLPGITPITLTASILFYIPGIRDLSCWLGFRQVSRRTFSRALRDRGSVVMCPGGQAELVYAHYSHRPPTVQKCPIVQQLIDAQAAAEPSSSGSRSNGSRPQLPAPASSSQGGSTDKGAIRENGSDAGRKEAQQPAVAIHASTNEVQREGGGKEGENGGGGAKGAQQKEQKQGVHKQQGPVSDACLAKKPDGSGGCGRELVIYAGHKGFVRLAVEQGAALVPVLALGEVLQLRNLIIWPSLQRWTYKRLGFPLPYLIGGRWAVTPFPAKTPLIYVIGEPIVPPPLQPGTPVPQDLVDKLHSKFYSNLASMFENHKHRHPEFAHGKLTLLYSHKI